LALTPVLQNCPGLVLLASVSGGADSTAMLSALAAIRDKCTEEKAAFDLRCIHVEHGIRPAEESVGDAEFTRRLCEKLSVPCRIVSVPQGKVEETAKKHGMGIEAAARLFRRRAWLQEVKRIETENAAGSSLLHVHIATAHTKDDLLETTLMRVLRGAGPSGLAAMPPAAGRFLRPLLAISRRDVTSYLCEKNITWREDATNADIRFFRNRVRHRLIPLLDEAFPQWRKAVFSLAETQSLAAGFIRNEAKRRVKWKISNNKEQIIKNEEQPVLHSLYTDVGKFISLPQIVREEALFQGVNRLLSAIRKSQPEQPAIPREIKRAVIRRFSRGETNAADLGPVRLVKNLQRVEILHGPIAHCSLFIAHSFDSGFSLLITAPGAYNFKSLTVEVKPCCQCGGESEKGCVFLPLVLRPGYKGDYISSGGKKMNLGGMICAEDKYGPAAFIGSGGRLFCDENPVRRNAGDDVFCISVKSDCLG